jgi:hypothetical protein
MIEQACVGYHAAIADGPVAPVIDIADVRARRAAR